MTYLKQDNTNYAAQELPTINNPSDTRIVSSELIDQLVDTLHTANQHTTFNSDVYLNLAVKYHIINGLFKHDFERALTDRKKAWYQRDIALTETQYMQLYELLKQLPSMQVIFDWITEQVALENLANGSTQHTSEQLRLRKKLQQRCRQPDLKSFTNRQHDISQYVDDLYYQFQQGRFSNRPGYGSHYEAAVKALFKYCELLKEMVAES